MNLAEKVKHLNLLRVPNEKEKIVQYFKDNKFPEYDALLQFEYVIWINGEPVFYSEKFIAETDVSNIELFLKNLKEMP